MKLFQGNRQGRSMENKIAQTQGSPEGGQDS
jgi:hypothetical protein